MSKIGESLHQRLGSVTSPLMEGDNISILLCGHFDNPDQENDDDTGWTPDAVTGCDEVLDAIRAHYAPLSALIEQQAREIARLREALAPLARGRLNLDGIDVERARAALEKSNVE